MNRTTALTLLQSDYAELATESQLNTNDLTTAYETAIDMSLRQLGYTEDLLPIVDVPQGQIVSYIALLNYYALKRFARAFAVRVNLTIGGQLSAQRSQAATQVKALLDDAEKEVVALGFAVGADAAPFGIGRLTLDFLEPNWSEIGTN
jgi:hypothetical protein